MIVSYIAWAFLVSPTYASWAYSFVVYDGSIYVVSETLIEADKIGSKIGKVTRYSDEEGTYRGNFSNHFAKGTEYFEIKNVKTTDAIAIRESDDTYMKAVYEGKYAGGRDDVIKNVIVYGLGAILFVAVVYVFIRRKR